MKKQTTRPTWKARFSALDRRWKEYALAGCVCILFFVVLTHLGSIFSWLGKFLQLFNSVILGAVFAYIINPLAVLLEKKVFRGVKKEKARWALSAIVTLIVVLLLLSLLLAALIPQIVDNILSLVNNLDTYVSNLQTNILRMNLPFSAALSEYLSSAIGEDGALSKLGELLSQNLKAILQATGNIGSAAMNWLVGAFMAIYFLLSKKAILGVFQKFLKLVLRSRDYIRTELMLKKFNTIFSKYIICEIVDSAIIGVVTGIFLLICGTPDALFLSAIAAITNLAPTFGPIIGAAIGSFILLLVDPAFILPFLIFTLVIQLLDSYLVKPKLFGGVLNVPGVVILIAIIVFGKLLGVVGMLIAIPAAAILVYLYSEVLLPWLELRQELKEYRKDIDLEKAQADIADDSEQKS